MSSPPYLIHHEIGIVIADLEVSTKQDHQPVQVGWLVWRGGLRNHAK